MKTTFTLLVFSLLFSLFSKGQWKFPVTDQDGRPSNYGIGNPSSKNIAISIATDKQTKSISPFNNIPNDPRGYLVYLEHATTVHVTALIKKDSLSNYRYSIFENDSIAVQSNVQFNKVDFTWPDHSDHPGYLTVNFGVSDVRNKKITIKMYRLSEENKVTTLIIYNRPLNSAKLLEANLLRKARVFKILRDYPIPIINIQDDTIKLKNDIRFNIDQKTRGIHLVMNKTDLDFVYQVTLKNTSADKDNPVFTSNTWTYGRSDEHPFHLIPPSYFSEPGSYELSVVPIVNDPYSNREVSKPVTISFRVTRPPITFSTTEVIIGLTILIFLTVTAFLLIRKLNKQKLIAANHQAEMAQTELTQVRSQLNPHFVFNALTGIQNLMNQHEVEKANSYLSKFARLTRNILNGKQLIALKDEHKLLDDYLSMEKLRFNFNYEIELETEADILEVMIPTMLLQPFVENAVKHSMSILGDQGKLLIALKSAQKDLILAIKDNGKGFDVEKVQEGFGLSLCKKRIDLLNQMYQECPISLEIDSSTTGTTIIITLNNWL